MIVSVTNETHCVNQNTSGLTINQKAATMGLQEELLTRVASSDVEDLVSGLDVLSDDILETRVALVPIELLLVLLVTVFPVFLLSVLCHFFLLITLQSASPLPP